jgi:hypothetical protein
LPPAVRFSKAAVLPSSSFSTVASHTVPHPVLDTDADLKNMKEFLDKRNSIYDQRQATAMRGWIDKM